MVIQVGEEETGSDRFWIYQGDHFVRYTNIESLRRIPETNKYLKLS